MFRFTAMTLFAFLCDFALGLALGGLGGLFGIGGGLLAIPALGVLFALDQSLAQGTALVMVVPNVLLSLRRYHQQHRIDAKLAAVLGGCSLASAWLGSRLAITLDATAMRHGFILFLLAIAAYYAWRSRRDAAPATTTRPTGHGAMALLGGGAGWLGGLFGVGGGVLATPILTSVFGLRQTVAQGLALTLAAPGTVVALLTYAGHGAVDWQLGLPLAAGGLLSVGWGVRLAHRLPERVLRQAFGGLLLGCALLLVWRG